MTPYNNSILHNMLLISIDCLGLPRKSWTISMRELNLHHLIITHRHLLSHRTIPSSSSYHPYHHNTNCHRHRHPIIVILSSSYHPSIIIISLPSLPSISSPSSHHLQNMHHLSFIVYLISQPVQRHNPSSSSHYHKIEDTKHSKLFLVFENSEGRV